MSHVLYIRREFSTILIFFVERAAVDTIRSLGSHSSVGELGPDFLAVTDVPASLLRIRTRLPELLPHGR